MMQMIHCSFTCRANHWSKNTVSPHRYWLLLLMCILKFMYVSFCFVITLVVTQHVFFLFVFFLAYPWFTTVEISVVGLVWYKTGTVPVYNNSIPSIECYLSVLFACFCFILFFSWILLALLIFFLIVVLSF